MSDDKILKQVNECIDNGTVMNLTLMENGLRAQRRLIEKLQVGRTQLATGLEPLTARQSKVFDAIESFIRARGYSPSIRDIGEAIGNSSPSTTFSIVEKLITKGYITRPSKYSLQIIGKREDEANAIRGNRSSY